MFETQYLRIFVMYEATKVKLQVSNIFNLNTFSFPSSPWKYNLPWGGRAWPGCYFNSMKLPVHLFEIVIKL